MTVRESDLGHLEYLAEGAFAQVFRVGGYTLPGDPAPLAYKRFSRDHAEQARAAVAAVAFRDGLSPAERADLDRFSTWPRALVTDAAGQVGGLLMALIPPELFSRYRDETGKLAERPLLMEYLVSTAQQRAAAEVDIGDVPLTERLVLLAQLVYVIARLHRHGWVFGDLSFKNAAFGLNPPRMMLLDCDGAAALSDHGRRQASTPNWYPPECTSPAVLQDDVTDVYKLGLAILRCLTPGKGAASSTSASRIDGELDDEGVRLLDRALSADRSVRPAARDLYAYLTRAVAARTSPPKVARVALATPFLVRGQDARVEWRIEDATRVEIRVGFAPPITVTPADHPHGYVFRPAESGRVILTACNHYAEVALDLGELNLYELPAFDPSSARLPVPRIPHLEPFRPPSVAAAVAGRPRIPVGGTTVTLEPIVPPAPPIAETAVGVAAEIREVITAVGADRAAMLAEAVTGLREAVAEKITRERAKDGAT